MKKCSRCFLEKQISEYHRASRTKDGFSGSCKLCKKILDKDYALNNSKAIKDKKREYYLKHKEEILLSCKEYRKKNPEWKKNYDRNYAKKYPERLAANRKRYYLKNPEMASKWKKQNPELHKKHVAEWKRNNKDRLYKILHKRRALKKIAGGFFDERDIKRILESQKYKCAYCRKSVKKNMSIDHIKALSKGGSNDKKNIQICCKSCNSRKNAKDPIDFARETGRLL